jgi:hypothetical protein
VPFKCNLQRYTTAASLDPARPGTAAAKTGASERGVSAAVAQSAAQLLHLPFTHPLPPAGTPAAAAAEAALQRYQEALLSEAIVVSLVQALDGLNAEELVAPMGLLSQLVLRWGCTSLNPVVTFFASFSPFSLRNPSL